MTISVLKYQIHQTLLSSSFSQDQRVYLEKIYQSLTDIENEVENVLQKGLNPTLTAKAALTQYYNNVLESLLISFHRIHMIQRDITHQIESHHPKSKRYMSRLKEILSHLDEVNNSQDYKMSNLEAIADQDTIIFETFDDERLKVIFDGIIKQLTEFKARIAELIQPQHSSEEAKFFNELKSELEKTEQQLQYRLSPTISIAKCIYRRRKKKTPSQ